MDIKWIGALLFTLILGATAGFRLSSQSGIQPGYFEKQEAPAYGVSEDKPMGSEFGKDYEKYLKELYKKE